MVITCSEVNGREHADSLRIYYKLDESATTRVYDYSYRKNEDYENQYYTDINIYGVLWDVRTDDLRICRHGEVLVNEQCFPLKRSLHFENKITEGVKSTSEIVLGNEYTIELWVYLPSQTIRRDVILVEKENHLRMSVSDDRSDLTLRFNGNDGYGNEDDVEYVESSVFGYDAWRHLTVANSHSLGVSEITVDRTEAIRDTSFYFRDTENYSSLLCVAGSCDSDLAFTINGFIHDLRLWRVFRNEGTIIRTMNYRLEGTEVFLEGYWRFNDQYGDTLTDYSENDLDLERPEAEQAPWVIPDVDIHLSRPNICSQEERFDVSSALCQLHPHYTFQPATSNTLLLPIPYSSDPMPEDFTFEFWIYLTSISSSAKLQWPERVEINIDSSYTLLYTLLGDKNSVFSSVALTSGKWLHIALSFLYAEGRISFYAFNYDDDTEIEEYSIYTTHQYGADYVGGTDINIITSSATIYIKELRLYSVFKELNSAVSARLEK